VSQVGLVIPWRVSQVSKATVVKEDMMVFLVCLDRRVSQATQLPHMLWIATEVIEAIQDVLVNLDEMAVMASLVIWVYQDWMASLECQESKEWKVMMGFQEFQATVDWMVLRVSLVFLEKMDKMVERARMHEMVHLVIKVERDHQVRIHQVLLLTLALKERKEILAGQAWMAFKVHLDQQVLMVREVWMGREALMEEMDRRESLELSCQVQVVILVKLAVVVHQVHLA